MTLSETEINSYLESGELKIDRPEGGIAVQPSSVDLHLGKKAKRYENRNSMVSVWAENTYPETKETAYNTIIIDPGEFILAHTEEVVCLPSGLVGYLQGRSSVGRLGLFVENAGLVDAGFSGDLTLELFNASKNAIELKPGMRICQMTLHKHTNPPNVDYSQQTDSKYQGQREATPSRLYEDFEQ